MSDEVVDLVAQRVREIRADSFRAGAESGANCLRRTLVSAADMLGHGLSRAEIEELAAACIARMGIVLADVTEGKE